MRAGSTSEKSSKEAAGVGQVPWHPVWGVIVTVGLYFVAPVLASAALLGFGLAQGWNFERINQWLTDSVGAQFTYLLLSQGAILGGLALFLRRYKRGFRHLGLRRPRWSDAGYAAAGFVVYAIGYLILAQIVQLLVPAFDTQAEQQIGFDQARGVLQLSFVFISLVILPPLVEEILMRGFLYSSLRKYRGVVVATILTSIVFAVAHLPGGDPAAGPLWVAAVDTFVLSLVLCHLRERTGRLWACIALHAMKNGLAFSLLFIFKVG